MLQIEDIYLGASRLINKLILDEFRAQGHSLTGAFEESLEGKTTKTRYTATLTGYGLSYGMVVNKGYTPSQISDKMFPGLVEYFVKRGLNITQAKRAAGATIAKWKNEGMSTQASKRFSSTGGRQHFIEAAMLDTSIDQYMTDTLDFGIDQKFSLVKNETI